MIQSRVGAYFQKLNDMEYLERGLEWYLIPGHYWLELRIHKQRNNFVTETNTNNLNTINLHTTNQDTVENRLNPKGKGNHKGEELKTEGPIGQDLSRSGRLSDLIEDGSDEDP